MGQIGPGGPGILSGAAARAASIGPLLGGGGGGGGVLKVQDVFATSLYTGSGANRSIANGLDLLGQGGLVWIKCRGTATDHHWSDTARGASSALSSNLTSAEYQTTDSVLSFAANGFNLGPDANGNNVNINARTYVAQSLRQAPKFLSIRTFTTDASGSYTGTHALGAAVGIAFLKARALNSNWFAWHRTFSNPARDYLLLNDTAPKTTNGVDLFSFTNSTFTVSGLTANATFVIYLFAHDPDTVNGIVQCGSFNTDSNGSPVVVLGWRPQFLLIKSTTISGDWFIVDATRGFSDSAQEPYLRANSSAAEIVASFGSPTSNGFFTSAAPVGANASFVYLAIRAPT